MFEKEIQVRIQAILYVERIVTQTNEMAQYNPYSIRRKSAGSWRSRNNDTWRYFFPNVRISFYRQVQLRFHRLSLKVMIMPWNFLANTFKDKGINLNSFITMKNQSKNITDSANEMI